MDELLSVKEIAARSGYTERTLRRWIANGVLPACRVGPRGIRIKRSDLDNLERPIPVGPIAVGR